VAGENLVGLEELIPTDGAAPGGGIQVRGKWPEETKRKQGSRAGEKQPLKGNRDVLYLRDRHAT